MKKLLILMVLSAGSCGMEPPLEFTTEKEKDCGVPSEAQTLAKLQMLLPPNQIKFFIQSLPELRSRNAPGTLSYHISSLQDSCGQTSRIIIDLKMKNVEIHKTDFLGVKRDDRPIHISLSQFACLLQKLQKRMNEVD